jgi:rubredoxin
MRMWQCSVCGFIFDGNEAPSKCPKCGAPQEKFEKLSDESVSKIHRSRFTNNIHMELFTLMEKAIDICKKGIEDDLDPPCVALFKSAIESSVEIQQKIKAELKVHMNRQKWG